MTTLTLTVYFDSKLGLFKKNQFFCKINLLTPHVGKREVWVRVRRGVMVGCGVRLSVV